MFVVDYTQEVIRHTHDTESARGAETEDIMTEQARAAQRAYKAEWRRRNPDKVKQQQERYWEKRAAQQAQETQPAQNVGGAQEE